MYSNLFDGIFSGKKVMVTGHTGFKGSWLCLLLHKLSADVYGYALNPPTNPSMFTEAGVNDFAKSFIGDIRDYEFLLKVMKEIQPEIIIHLAAQPIVRESYRNPAETFAVNVMGTVNLFETVRQVAGIKAVVNVTTDKCYAEKVCQSGYSEKDALGGNDPYSASKACSELVTSSFRNSFFNPHKIMAEGVAVASARAGNVIGGGDWAADRLIPDFIRSISKGESLKIRNPSAVRPWQHVLEPLNGYLTLASKLLTAEARYADSWNFGTNPEDAKNVEWVAKRLADLWGNGASFAVDESPQPPESNILLLDCSKAKTELGWKPVWDINTALKATVDWSKAFVNGEDIRKITFDQMNSYFGDARFGD